MANSDTATIWHRTDCNRVYVREEAVDGLSKDEWCFDFPTAGGVRLRALFHHERISRRRKWTAVESRCWVENATDTEAIGYLPTEAVPLPASLGPLAAWVIVRREAKEGDTERKN